MKRFVYNFKWQPRFGWAVAIAMFLAVGVFGAPPITIAGVIAGEMLFFALLTHRYPLRPYPYERDHADR